MPRSIVYASLFFLFIANTPVTADDWVDNWIQQSTYSRPNTYETQKRGYVTGGKLSLRYRQDTDYLANVSLPSFKKGCGGIDLFNGSMSYLDSDRLMTKFQNIMSGALATYAFDLALNVLCEPCAKEIKSLEAITDRINQLQIDDCKATKAVVAVMKNESGVGDSAKNTEAITEFMTSSGLAKQKKDYYEATIPANNKDVQTVMRENKISKNMMVRACPDVLKKLFFTEGTLLENIAEQLGIDAGKVELMRGLVGDVYISADLEYGMVAPCPQNNPANIDAVIYGDFYRRQNGVCVKDRITIDGRTHDSLFDWSRTNIIEIILGIINKKQLSPQNELFINTIPHSIFTMIKTDIMMQGAGFDIQQATDRYAHTASVVFAHAMMRDLYNDLNHMLTTAEAADFNSRAGGNVDCQISLKDKAQGFARKIQQNVKNYSAAVNSNYQTAVTEAMEQSRYAQTLRQNRKSAEQAGAGKVVGQ